MIARLEVDDVVVARQHRRILENVNLRLGPGEFVSIEGPSGIGKSTLLLALAGLHPVERGTVYIDGVPLGELPPLERARRIAIAVQSPVLPHDLTLGDFVRLGCRPHQAQWKTHRSMNPCDLDVVEDALDAVALRAYARRTLASLSGGEQRRAQLARVLAQRTPILLLDEPTTHLDDESCRRIVGALCERAYEGTAILMVTHDGSVARRYCHRRLWLQDKTLFSVPKKPQERQRLEVL